MNDRLLSIFGLCRRAGKLIIGADPVTDSVLKGKADVVVTTKDFSNNSKKNILKATEGTSVKVLKINRTKDELSLAVGKFCAVVAVEDKGFSKKIQELILKEQEQEE